MEKKYIHYKKVEGNFGIEIDESVAKKYIKLKKENFTLKIGSIIKLTFPKEHIFFF